MNVDPRLAMRIAPSLAWRKLVLPLARTGDEVVVACADELDEATRAALVKAFSPLTLKPLRLGRDEIRRQLVRVFGGAASAAAEDDPVALTDAIFRAARLARASDIHFNPDHGALAVNFRVDGEIERFREYPPAAALAIVNRIKVLSKMDIAERRVPQDGGFTLPGERFGSVIDVRAATLPARGGERVTLRLLAAAAGELTLSTLGMDAAQLKAVSEVLASPHGLFLLTGPTGSGKSTTLYAAIRHLIAARPLNVLTVENPIEYEIPGAVQCEVDEADKVSFAKALRSLLRHDPDVVMIGEIRDRESLDVAVKAALTGHLVLSTLHANDAVGAVTRLRNLELEDHLIAATLRVSIAQRLVRRLCGECHGAGCLACSGRGFFGRLGLFEIFRPDAALSALVADGAGEAVLRSAALGAGFVPLKDDAAAKVAAGLTTAAEVAHSL